MGVLSRRDLLETIAVLPPAPPARLPVGIVSRRLQWTRLQDAIELAKIVTQDLQRVRAAMV